MWDCPRAMNAFDSQPRLPCRTDLNVYALIEMTSSFFVYLATSLKNLAMLFSIETGTGPQLAAVSALLAYSFFRMRWSGYKLRKLKMRAFRRTWS